MTSDIHQAADRLAAEFRALGRSVSISHSTNRNGDFSSYLEVSGIRDRLRISDHFSGTTLAVDVSPLSSAQDILDDVEAAKDRNEEHKRAEAARWARVKRQREEEAAAAEVRRLARDAWLEARGYPAEVVAAMRYEDRREIFKAAYEATK